MTFYVAARKVRLSPYMVRSSFAHYGEAKLEQLRLRTEVYDAQIFSDKSCRREALVYTNPKIQALPFSVSPYDRLYRLVRQLHDPTAFRLLVSRPSPGQGIPHYRMFLFGFQREFGKISFTTHQVDLRRDADVITRFDVRYAGGAAGEAAKVDFVEHPPETIPVFGSRMQGIFIADVAEDWGLYFGYTEASATESKVVFDQFRSTFGINLYDLK